MASLYPAYYVPARGSAKTDPYIKALLNKAAIESEVEERSQSKAMLKIGEAIHDGFLDGFRKSNQDIVDAVRYITECQYYCEKEESMNIVIYRSTSWGAREASRYFEERLKDHPYGQNVAMTCGGLRFSGITNALRIWICYADCEKMAGIHPDYFSSDSAEATEYLRQRISSHGDTHSHGLYKLWTIISKYLNEQYAPKDEDTYDWMAHSCTEIMADMGTILHRRQIAEKDFKSKEWVWEISEDVWRRLREKPEFITNCYSTSLPASIYGIEVRVTNLKTNHIELVKKEKENAMDKLYITKNGILELDGVRYPVRINEVCQAFNEPTHVNLYVTGEGNSNYMIMPRHSGYSAHSFFIDELHWAAQRSANIPGIKKVMFEDPATIVFWKDGTKTVVQARGEKFDPEKGLAMAISKKAMGNTRDYYIPFKKWLKKFKKKEVKKVAIPHCSDCKHGDCASNEIPCAVCVGCYDGYPSHFEPKDK